MAIHKKLIEVTGTDGSKLEVMALCREERSTSIDEPSSTFLRVRYVIINNQAIWVEGLGYFDHPDTGISYEI